jgi:predicted peptidase
MTMQGFHKSIRKPILPGGPEITTVTSVTFMTDVTTSVTKVTDVTTSVIKVTDVIVVEYPVQCSRTATCSSTSLCR